MKLMWDAQRAYSEKLYDVDSMDDDARDVKTREFALALHHEVSKLVSAVNFRGHHRARVEPNRTRVLYEAVDAIRYAMAICNLWDFNDKDFSDAWCDKDAFLNMQHTLQQRTWSGEPVVIVDIDDVIAEFRQGFSSWLMRRHGIHVDPNCSEYYFIESLVGTNMSSLELYEQFVSERNMVDLEPSDAVEAINRLSRADVWVQLVTARPRDNLPCRYDTYHWLRDSGVCFDGIAFTGEKLAWVTHSRFHTSGRVACAVDDGPSHVISYATHGMRTLMPIKSYNEHISHENVVPYRTGDELYDNIITLVDEMRDEDG